MEALHFLGLFMSFLLILYKILYQNKSQHKINLPPSPPSLPIIGHFHLLKGISLTRSLIAVSNRYGPIVFLRLGNRRALAVSSPSAVEECFTKNDIVFANRPYFSTWGILEYGYTAVGVAPYGDSWRNLRRITAIEVFSSSRMQIVSCIRAEEIRFLVKELFRASPKKADVNRIFYVLSFNIMTRLFAGYRHFDGDCLYSDKNEDEVEATKDIFTPHFSVDLVDYFPFLRLLGGFYRKKEMLKLLRKREDFIRTMIDVNVKGPRSPPSRRTFVDALLSLQESEPEVYTNDLVNGLITTFLIGGTHSSELSMASTVSHLLSHPDILKKARDEIDANVPQTRLLDDSLLAKLPYLHCIINESLRIGPVGSIIPLHESSEDCKIGGYDVPRGTMLFVNVCALHRNPKVWADPNKFKPERFLGMEESQKGGASFMPFGLGRRKCPGWSMAMRSMALALGTLIQCFEWEGRERSIGPKVGRNMVPILESEEVIFRPREGLVDVLSRL